MFKINNGGVQFEVQADIQHPPEIILAAAHDPSVFLYKLILGHETTVQTLDDGIEKKFTSRRLFEIFSHSSNTTSKELYVSWHSHRIKVGLAGEEPFVDCPRRYDEPKIGFVNFRTSTEEDRIPLQWIVETSPVKLEPVPCKSFGEALYWCSMINGKLPPDAMIGGFEKEFIYIARAHHNRSMCPGKYVPSTGMAFIPWGFREHRKDQFEILCGYNSKWVKTSSNNIPSHAIIGGRSEVQNDPLYIGRAMIDGKLICGKVHVRYHLCYLPYDGAEISVSSYEILVLEN